ncbi:hypothetical protein CC1G_15776 [Coprinopsis cinerea okayama7|uniref:Extracellular membrane protein CFEM domain-containing protein n=1 Tax=Coprinopsis cinerea (strain Okayama-7 / 130 / ATCC MYA-4618 / FGSC 9003) TaxID=240176 RepID=D6RR19_COPC7|nr:hypothetical protein CC1G_15776 [Coprinopsis cinerea okayama7\|eukprot:XP_002910056.1 hypothetical protein CC1G_15776 [Coprinopsis cinerea okayama7\
MPSIRFDTFWTWIAIICFLALQASAQLDLPGRPDSQVILEVVVDECRSSCSAISETLGDCSNVQCLCTEDNNEDLFECLSCLYGEGPIEDIYDAVQQTLDDFAITCEEYDIEPLIMPSDPPSTSTPSSSTSPPASSSSASASEPSSAPTSTATTPRNTSPTSETVPRQTQKCLVVRPHQRVLSKRSPKLRHALSHAMAALRERR